ncbi:MAG: lysoplasmalogenase [Ilumatobacteraceae bacterium]
MTALAWVFLAVFSVAAVANWWTRWTENRRVELWSKPIALLALIGVALAIDPVEPTVRAWFVAALACSLAGDVLLLDDRRFVAGLAAFLLAHVAYTIGLILGDEWSGRQFAGGVVLMLVVGASVGRKIVNGAERESPVLGSAVIAYLVAISLMFAAAGATGNPWAIVGAGLFVTSDAVLGWRRFVGESRWMAPAIMVTYHLGQAGLVAGLLWVP